VYEAPVFSCLSHLEGLQSSFEDAPRPFVTVAFAISRDGCLSRTRGRGTRISGEESQRFTHQVRALHQGLLVGVGTILSDDPQLTTRLVKGPSPRRVVLDSRLRVPANARVLSADAGPTVVVTTSRAAPQSALALEQAGAQVVRVAAAESGVSLDEVLKLLRDQGVRSLMVEGGAAVLESFFKAGVIDYLAVTVSQADLDNPEAVQLGPTTAAAIKGWREEVREQLGEDTLRAGRMP
jgi:GTP cyclohydrolase II